MALRTCVTHAHDERRLSCLVQSHRKASVEELAEKVNDGYDRKESVHSAAYEQWQNEAVGRSVLQ